MGKIGFSNLNFNLLHHCNTYNLCLFIDVIHLWSMLTNLSSRVTRHFNPVSYNCYYSSYICLIHHYLHFSSISIYFICLALIIQKTNYMSFQYWHVFNVLLNCPIVFFRDKKCIFSEVNVVTLTK